MPHTADMRQLFVTSHVQLREVAARILGCRQRADDVVQDAYLKLGDGTGSATVRNPAAYLSRLVRNLAIDGLRRRHFEWQVFTPEEDGEHVASASATPEARALQLELLAQVARALSLLPERTRAAFELHHLGGQTQREVAAQLGVSATLVNFMIRDATLSCRDALVAA